MSLEDYSKKRFLIVDELDSFRFSTKKMLMSLGIKLIDTATSGQQVIAGFQNVDYDVILCNFDLGKGKNGQELLEELREKRLLKFTSLFFIVSAEVAKDKVMGTVENEPDGYIVKPVTTANLKKRLLDKLTQKDATRSICQAIDNEDYEKAIALCEEAILDKSRYTLWCMKTQAWLLTKLGKQQEALAIYEKAAKNAHQDWALFGVAKIAKSEHKLDKSREVLTALIEKSPNRIEAYDLLAQVHLEQDQPLEAEKVLEEAIANSPNSVLRQRMLAGVYLKNRQPEKALETFRRVVKLGEKSIHSAPEHYLDFANSLTTVAKGDLSGSGKQLAKEALEALQKANKQFPDSPNLPEKTKLIEAKVHFAQDRKDEANQLIDSVTEANQAPPSDLALTLADTLYFVGRADDAEAALNSIADQHTEDKTAATVAAELRETNISQQRLIKAASLNKQGIEYHGKGDLDNAIAAFEKAAALTPHHISLNLNLLQLLLKKRRDSSSPNDLLPQCQQCLKNIRHIKPSHKEHRRYQQLKKLVTDAEKQPH